MFTKDALETLTQAEAISADFIASEREAGSARTTPFEGGEALKALIK